MLEKVKVMSSRVVTRILIIGMAVMAFVVSAFAQETPPTFDYDTASSTLRDGVVNALNIIWPYAAGLLAIFLGIRLIVKFMRQFSRG